ncbi:ATP-binding cassette domain-containing protein [Mycoplasma sp. OR1901]|uniref:ABC transporter ATP-binding protein n=1 Tax=Mycoplasma sp. OR1901 TaxID=2742195 RepID=UPI0015839E0A|nr:ATP-binding cassette domain-containing protein [Mycoplasma sp. OR1901]QKT05703.1 ATP-binding cassette domain-containing protein [Mycoplasma sp. OR1901]
MFEIHNLKFKNILNIEHLKFEVGKINVIVGASGVGKTTLLRMLNKLNSPTSGEILYKQKNIEQISSLELRKEVLMLPQNPILLGDTIEENLTAPFNYQNKPKPSQEKMKKCLEQVKLIKELTDLATNLSGGEKQRLALARILLLEPEVYLLDEPSSMLDKETEDFIINYLVNFAKENNKTIIMITHSKEVASKYADNIIELQKITEINKIN